ncbi:hypothetical protein MLD38_040101 [Melastoma candidum]|uniref:Uncharacterized protein n=1 Tax=Melastoma candidum TaxID=119954 RepID=A0ACB9L6G9_9MYRT|nr:hypothetical protein MLD38_040101 [Melastoma candidum]
MAALVGMAAFVPSSGRMFAATAAKVPSGGKQEKSLLDWILGGLEKDHLLETDPILKKVEEKSGTVGKSSVSVPPKKKNGGFGGLFAKN